jgi:hypothetical protein
MSTASSSWALAPKNNDPGSSLEAPDEPRVVSSTSKIFAELLLSADAAHAGVARLNRVRPSDHPISIDNL